MGHKPSHQAMPPVLHTRLFLIHTLGSFSEKKPSPFSTLANPAGPHYGHPHGTPLHKLSHCPAHAADRFESEGHLKSLSIGRGLHHMTLGIHSTYDAMPNEHVPCPIFLKVSIDVFWATLVLPTRATLFRRCLILLRLGSHVLGQLGNIQFATAFLEGARPSANTDLPSIHGAPPCEPNVWGDG